MDGDARLISVEARLRREDYVVDADDHWRAELSVGVFHYSHSAPNTDVYCHALYPAVGYPLSRPVGHAIWLPPTRAAAEKVCREGEDWRGVLALSRLVVEPEVPKNGASFLLGRSMRLIDRERWPILLTYADTRLGHTGAIYLATNWVDEGLVPAGDVWLGPNGEQRGRKRGGRNLSVVEMRALGFERAPALPKRRFTHRISR